MYIDKLEPFIDTSNQWYSELEEELKKARELKDTKKMAELFEVMQNKEDEKLVEAEKRYAESFSDNPDRIFQDFQEVINGITQKYFEEWLDIEKEYFHHVITTSEKWVECCEYIRRLSAVQLRVIEHYGLDIQKAYYTIAAKAAEWYEPPEHEEEKKIISVAGKKVEKIIMPIDILSEQLFKGTTKGKYIIDASKSGESDNAIIECTIDYVEEAKKQGLQIDLTPEKERLLNNICALFHAGNEYISYNQIFGVDHDGNATTNILEDMDKKIVSMMGTLITINNKTEAEVYNYPLFEYTAPLLPAERAKHIMINGKEAEYAIHLLKEPIIMTFSKCRGKNGQIATFTRGQWVLPLRQTETNLMIDRYFRKRIVQEKRNGKKSFKMLYDTIYRNCGINTKKKRFDATNKFRKLLSHYQSTKLIINYTERQDGITITI